MKDDSIRLRHELSGCILKHKPVAALSGGEMHQEESTKHKFYPSFKGPLDNGGIHGSEKIFIS